MSSVGNFSRRIFASIFSAFVSILLIKSPVHSTRQFCVSRVYADMSAGRLVLKLDSSGQARQTRHNKFPVSSEVTQTHSIHTCTQIILQRTRASRHPKYVHELASSVLCRLRASPVLCLLHTQQTRATAAALARNRGQWYGPALHLITPALRLPSISDEKQRQGACSERQLAPAGLSSSVVSSSVCHKQTSPKSNPESRFGDER